MRTLTAEVPDLELHTADSSLEAIELLKKESFDMVISANEMEQMNGTDVHLHMRDSGRHNTTGFLLLTSKLDKQNKKIFKEKRIDNVLKLPFKAGELARQVDLLSVPREWRRHLRIDVPGTKVRIHLGHRIIQADIVNLSMGGMLCNLKVEPEGIPEFSRFYTSNILFPPLYGSVSVNVDGYVLRQAGLQWFEPPKLEIIQCAWRLSEITGRAREIMQDILDKASDEPDMIDE